MPVLDREVVRLSRTTGRECASASGASDGDARAGDGCDVGLVAASRTSRPGALGGDAGGGDGEVGADAVVCALASASVHAFDFVDFFVLATPLGRLGVTSARHEERAAKTPW